MGPINGYRKVIIIKVMPIAYFYENGSVHLYVKINKDAIFLTILFV